MGPLTERFEMRLEASTLEKVDRWRSAQADLPSRAEAIRRLVDQGLMKSNDRTDIALDKPQMLTIWLLTEVLKHTKGYDDPKTVKLIQQAIYGGHLWALDWEMTGVLHDHRDNRDNVSVVVDILDVWDFVEEAWAKFDEKDRERIAREVGPWAKEPKFLGFDGNNETEYLGIADFLVNQLDRFRRFKGRSMNSHMPTVARYRNMAANFEMVRASMIGGNTLSPDQVIALLKRS
jgi:uncharacterized protein YfbU (UPF0304 family)